MNPRRTSLLLAAVVALPLGCGGASAPPDALPSEPPGAGAVARQTVTGRVAAAAASTTGVVVLQPSGAEPMPSASQSAILDQAGTEFVPALLLAQAGQTVQFRNSEDVLHNVRVTEAAGETPIFNVATPPFGSYEHAFERTGFYSVSCDIHSTMRADILVTASPYTATTDAEGRFTIREVPSGTYTLTLYAGATPVVRSIEVKSGLTDLGVIQ